MMRKLLAVAGHEFRQHALKWSYILVLLSVPLIVSLNVGLGLILESLENNDAPVGYVDLAGFLDDPLQAPLASSKERIEMRAFASETSAREALEAGVIQGYYVFPPEYPTPNHVKLFFEQRMGDNAHTQFFDFLQINLLQNLPAAEAERAARGTDITIRSPDGTRNFPSSGPQISQILPLIIALAFIFLILISSGSLMSGLAEEKENRMMEVLMTSVSPTQMVGGKIVAIVAMGLLQLVVWFSFLALAVWIGAEGMGVEWFQNVDLNWGTIVKIVAVALPSYVAASALMFMLGATVAQAQEGQSLSAFFFIIFFLPFYMIVLIVESPNTSPAVILTLLPFTSLMTIALRSLFFSVPLWQILISVVIQSVFAVLMIWLAGRAYRLGMLRYGKRLSLKEILPRRRSSLQEVKSI
jgi:ABC-2 type transport system permease protein